MKQEVALLRRMFSVLCLLPFAHVVAVLADGQLELLKQFKIVPPSDRQEIPGRPIGSLVVPSLFPEYVPPYVNFSQCTDPKREIPKEVKKYLIWVQSLTRVNEAILKTGLRLVGRSDSEQWFGFFNAYGSKTRTPKAVLKYSFQKYNLLPGAQELCDKDKLWYNVQRLAKKFGKNIAEFDFLLETYVYPDEIFQYLKRLTFRCIDEEEQFQWLYKPAATAMSNGFIIFQNTFPLEKLKRGIIQKFMSDPFGGSFIRYRMYVLQTGFHPLRVYVFKKGECLLKNSPLSWLDVYIENDELLNVFTKEGHDPKQIQARMEDAILKSLFSAERRMTKKSHAQLKNSYNAYQLWSADFMFDKFGIPWMNEFNRYVSFWIHYDVHYRIKVPLITETLNVAGYHFPPTMSPEARKFVQRHLLHHNNTVFNHELYSFKRSAKTKAKVRRFLPMFQNRKDYLNSILDNLQVDEVKQLMIAEDELSRTENYKRIFPTSTTYPYLQYLESSDPYPYMLQDAWENKYGHNRTLAIDHLRTRFSKLTQETRRTRG